MAELKTKKTEASVEDFLNGLQSEQTRVDCFEIVKIMKQATIKGIIFSGRTRNEY